MLKRRFPVEAIGWTRYSPADLINYYDNFIIDKKVKDEEEEGQRDQDRTYPGTLTKLTFREGTNACRIRCELVE